MKRYIKSSTTVYDKINTLTMPSKFTSNSVVYVDGKTFLKFVIENMGVGRVTVSLIINGSRGGRYTENVDSIEDAIEKCYEMYDKYTAYKTRFRGRNLTDSEIHEMMYT